MFSFPFGPQLDLNRDGDGCGGAAEGRTARLLRTLLGGKLGKFLTVISEISSPGFKSCSTLDFLCKSRSSLSTRFASSAVSPIVQRDYLDARREGEKKSVQLWSFLGVIYIFVAEQNELASQPAVTG